MDSHDSRARARAHRSNAARSLRCLLMGERDWAPPDWPVGLPLPDLSRPPPWLLPPPPLGTPPPGCPPGGWAQSWDTAVPWPPSQPPSEWSAEEEEEEEEWEEEAGAVVWRVGDPVQADGDEEEEEEDETVLELNEEWVARFAVTAHRRAARKQFERESLAGGGQRHAAPPAVPSGGRIESRGGASVSAPQTVLELVQAARAGTTRPNEALYGAAAGRVAALEMTAQAAFESILAARPARLWPCEALRSVP